MPVAASMSMARWRRRAKPWRCWASAAYRALPSPDGGDLSPLPPPARAPLASRHPAVVDEQQMLTIARVRGGDPSLLLADEPSEGLAAMTVADIHSILGNPNCTQCGRSLRTDGGQA